MEATAYNGVDITIGILLLIFIFIGWKKGFLRSLIGPICFGIFVVIGIIVYDATENLFRALLTVVLGTLICSFIINLLAFLAQRTVQESDRGKKLVASRLLGAAINVSWKSLVLGAVLILLCEVAYIHPRMKDLGTAVEASASYAFVTRYFVYRNPRTRQVVETIAILRDPELLAQVKNTPEFRTVYADPKVSGILNDAELRRQIREGEIKNLLQNPRIKDLMQDEELMRKLSKLSRAAYRTQNPEPAPQRLGH